MDLNLSGRRALVTGGSRGIGRAVAAGLAEEGCELILAARDEVGLADARQEIAGDVRTIALDLSAAGSAEALVAAAGPVDILVNNAGAIPSGTIEDVDEETWRQAWELKVFGYVNLTRLVYAEMARRGSGVIVNVIGLAGERPGGHYIAGSAANAALMAFTQALGGISPDRGVRVLGVNPGDVSTDRLTTGFRRRAQKAFGDEERWQEFLADLPMGRAAEPREVADVVTFLASDRASYVSGTIVTVDAGYAGRGYGHIRPVG